MSELRKPQERKFNPKRRVLSEDDYIPQKKTLEEKSKSLGYEGKGEHKLNPGDFNLFPPASGRIDKTLCDLSKIFTHKEALILLREGYRKRIFDPREHKGWPRHIWAVVSGDIVLEAKPSMAGSGIYHGYPLPPSDPLCEVVLKIWKER